MRKPETVTLDLLQSVLHSVPTFQSMSNFQKRHIGKKQINMDAHNPSNGCAHCLVHLLFLMCTKTLMHQRSVICSFCVSFIFKVLPKVRRLFWMLVHLFLFPSFKEVHPSDLCLKTSVFHSRGGSMNYGRHWASLLCQTVFFWGWVGALQYSIFGLLVNVFFWSKFNGIFKNWMVWCHLCFHSHPAAVFWIFWWLRGCFLGCLLLRFNLHRRSVYARASVLPSVLSARTQFVHFFPYGFCKRDIRRDRAGNTSRVGRLRLSML